MSEAPAELQCCVVLASVLLQMPLPLLTSAAAAEDNEDDQPELHWLVGMARWLAEGVDPSDLWEILPESVEQAARYVHLVGHLSIGSYNLLCCGCTITLQRLVGAVHA